MNLTESFLDFTLLGAEWVLWLLIALSVVSVTIAVERWRFYRRRQVDIDALESEVREAMEGKPDEAVLDRYGDSDALPLVVARAALAEADSSADAVAQAMTSARTRARVGYERYLVVLGTLGNNAPFIGLFGTVLGIIKAFNDLAASPGGDANVVMAGISEALVATAVGLLVAIPAVVLFNYFNRQVRAAVAQADGLAHGILGILEKRELAERELTERGRELAERAERDRERADREALIRALVAGERRSDESTTAEYNGREHNGMELRGVLRAEVG